jgi:Tol biopolymer transport system component
MLGGGAVIVLLVIAGSALLAQAGANGVSLPRVQQVFLVDVTGRVVKQLTSGRVAHSNVMWLPGGGRVAELASRGALSWVESRTRRGTGAQKLSSTVSTPNTAPAMVYSPSARITAAGIFNENRLSDTLELLGAPRTRPTVIDTFPDTGGGPSNPAWSPDGRTLAYTRPKGPVHTPTVGPVTAGSDRIVLLNIRTRTRRIITAGNRGAAAPLFSPNGKWILYTEGSGNYVALDVAPARGGRSRQIASNLSLVSPAWSPDGRNIAFTGYTKGNGQPYLFVLNVRTKRLRRLAGSMQLLTPAWSPDSKEIAFATWPTALVPAPPQGYGAVEIITPQGTGARVLASVPKSLTVDLAWSPNGSQIAFTLQAAPKGRLERRAARSECTRPTVFEPVVNMPTANT